MGQCPGDEAPPEWLATAVFEGRRAREVRCERWGRGREATTTVPGEVVEPRTGRG